MTKIKQGWPLVLLLASACARVEPETTTEFRNLTAEYTGDAACFDCHQEQWTGFQEHGMARSFYRLTADNVVEDFTAPPLWHEKSGFYYRVFADNGAYFQEEFRLGPQNTKTHRLIRRIDYVVGSGNAARTYLTESNGHLYEMPLTWYNQNSTWDFSPGYQIFNKRFDRLVPDRCMACHNSYPETVEFVEGKYESLPQGIGCERCHGPGSLHVAERLAGGGAEEGLDPTIVNPARMIPALQMDVCQQCHLHTTVSVLRDGRGPFDFRPSERLENHLALFSAPDTSHGLDVISHAERLAKSACFIETAPSMTCTTCHNPHEGFRGKGPDYFNSTCISCHVELPDHEARTNCIDCHMPRVPADGAPHAEFTDHWIRTVAEESFAPAHAPLRLSAYFARDSLVGRRMEAMATLVHGVQQADSAWLEKGITLARTVLEEDSTGETHFLIGIALTRLGRADESIRPLEQALLRQSNIPERLNALAQAYEASNTQLEQAGDLYERALALEPSLADIRVNYGRYLETRGDLQAALEQYRLAAAEKPWLVEAQYNYGTAAIQDGAFEEAERSLSEALVLNPDHADALGNLGLLYLSQDRESEAGELFARAVEANPANAIALSNLGTWYFNRGNYTQAIIFLERAIAEEPDYLGALVNLAFAHARSANHAAARRIASHVLQLDPQNEAARTIMEALQ